MSDISRMDRAVERNDQARDERPSELAEALESLAETISEHGITNADVHAMREVITDALWGVQTTDGHDALAVWAGAIR